VLDVIQQSRERGVVLADAEEGGRAYVRREQLDRHRLARGEVGGVGVHLDDTVGLDEARRRAAALVDGVDESIARPVLDEADGHESGATLAVALLNGHLPLDGGGPRVGEAGGGPNRRRDEGPEDGQRGDGVAREADVRGVVEAADQHRLARFDRDAVQEEFPLLLDDAVDHVDGAGGGRSRGEHEVTLVGGLDEQPLHLLVVVAGVGVENGLTAGLLDARGDGVGVHVVDLAGGAVQGLAGADEFVAGGDDADRRRPANGNGIDAECRQQTDLPGRE